MTNTAGNYRGREEENQRIGRQLHEQDQKHKRYEYRGKDTRQWGEGNYFHTGPNPRGAQDSPERKYGENYRHDRNQTYAQGRNAHLRDHYGSRSESPYRNERSYLDHGDQYQHSEQHSMRRPHQPGGSLEGNYNDVNEYKTDPWREGPGSGSRFKETDYRYGSGSHNWYREGRYTPDEERSHNNRGFFQRMKDTWDDIMHSDEPGYKPHSRYESQADRLDSRKRYGSEVYRDRNFNRGYEGGPRWADEVDSGHDDYYNDTDRTQRYRR
ncbi:MAG: hypothetical protein LPK07_05460 [Hymenobacteraceae bacterium]|nr:hypothetical protein [Hymenobacteraceae bacterium]MDX5481109.1 hypothetical protein [Hymenobacteraceae bacterium]